MAARKAPHMAFSRFFRFQKFRTFNFLPKSQVRAQAHQGRHRPRATPTRQETFSTSMAASPLSWSCATRRPAGTQSRACSLRYLSSG